MAEQLNAGKMISAKADGIRCPQPWFPSKEGPTDDRKRCLGGGRCVRLFLGENLLDMGGVHEEGCKNLTGAKRYNISFVVFFLCFSSAPFLEAFVTGFFRF